jgi:hypothetical protein
VPDVTDTLLLMIGREKRGLFQGPASAPLPVAEPVLKTTDQRRKGQQLEKPQQEGTTSNTSSADSRESKHREAVCQEGAGMMQMVRSFSKGAKKQEKTLLKQEENRSESGGKAFSNRRKSVLKQEEKPSSKTIIATESWRINFKR